jgi:isopentenyl-diphosphate delta-isomerase
VKIDKVILVDEEDNQTGTVEKMEAHKKALLHRAVSVFIFNSKNQMLIQKRALNKYHSPGLWTNTACTHPLPGESDKDAAKRRLAEEMGLSTDLNEVFNFIYKAKLDNDLTEHEFDHVFIGFSDNLPNINTDEVADYKYILIEALRKDIAINPGHYTAWFKIILKSIKRII